MITMTERPGGPRFDPHGPHLVYMLIADDIAAQIERGELVPGQRLPGEADLATEYRRRAHDHPPRHPRTQRTWPGQGHQRQGHLRHPRHHSLTTNGQHRRQASWAKAPAWTQCNIDVKPTAIWASRLAAHDGGAWTLPAAPSPAPACRPRAARTRAACAWAGVMSRA